MKKKPYVEPQTKVVEVDDVEIICTSTEGLTQDNFDWGGGSSGSSIESLTEENFGW